LDQDGSYWETTKKELTSEEETLKKMPRGTSSIKKQFMSSKNAQGCFVDKKVTST
jgi:hypothetical protein